MRKLLLKRKILLLSTMAITLLATASVVVFPFLFESELHRWAPGFLMGIILLSAMNTLLSRKPDSVTVIFQISALPLLMVFLLENTVLPFRLTEILLVLTLAASGWGIGRLVSQSYVKYVSLLLSGAMILLLIFSGESLLHLIRILYPVMVLVWIIASAGRFRSSVPARLILLFSVPELINFILPFTPLGRTMPALLLLSHSGFLLIPCMIRAIGEKGEALTILPRDPLLTDPGTGLPNRRYLEEKILPELSAAKGNRMVLMIEVDHLMEINARGGFAIGDMMIRNLVHCFKPAGLKETDSLCRYSGLQFLILREGARGQNSHLLELADRIRQRFLTEKFPDELPADIRPGLSCGIANHPSDSADIREVIRKAETALKYSRKEGENRNAIWTPATARTMDAGHSEFVKTEMLMDFVLSLARAIDAKDAYTGQHSHEVSRYALMIADVLALPEEMRHSLRMGGLLHDVGKLGIPDMILQKQSRLDDQEFKIIQSHTTIGYNIAHQIFQDSEIISCVRNHHEKWDGSGYPDGLCGEQIPLLSRIICVADAYHAMVSNRVYRTAMTHKKAMAQLMEYSNRQFDPMITAAFLKANL